MTISSTQSSPVHGKDTPYSPSSAPSPLRHHPASDGSVDFSPVRRGCHQFSSVSPAIAYGPHSDTDLEIDPSPVSSPPISPSSPPPPVVSPLSDEPLVVDIRKNESDCEQIMVEVKKLLPNTTFHQSPILPAHDGAENCEVSTLQKNGGGENGPDNSGYEEENKMNGSEIQNEMNLQNETVLVNCNTHKSRQLTREIMRKEENNQQQSVAAQENNLPDNGLTTGGGGEDGEIGGEDTGDESISKSVSECGPYAIAGDTLEN
ncbi:hypothetical protein QAD02_016771 [Eretmocerus hayati]|uniref:Uncharacterized protein n=1 Tax=Eretmocerus hayati TaxID=131215 RepID=A0ACC2PCH4_9HYME|nr:hypothetical protein QAD02_016771 [Eretmocerus hayati]